jgi:hypothetical protein
MIDSKKLKNFTLHVMLSAAGEDVLAHTVIRNVIST